MRVVIVEDELLVAMDLQAVLEDLGHSVAALATTVPGALAEIEAHRPDLITVDLHLAELGSGLEVARAAYLRWGIPALFVSGNIDARLIAQAAPLRPLGYLGKPFSTRQVERALAASRLAAAAA